MEQQVEVAVRKALGQLLREGSSKALDFETKKQLRLLFREGE